MSEPNVALLADAGPSTGAGHVMRCLSLAAALQGMGLRATLSSAGLPGPLRDRAVHLRVPVIDRCVGQDDPAVVQGLPASTKMIVRDGYQFSDASAAALDDHAPVVVIDDAREAPLGAPAAVLNQNLHATESMYSDVAASVALMIGPRWSLVREEIVSFRARPRQRVPRRVVVALGGADVLGLASSIRDATKAEHLDAVSPAGLMGAAPSSEPDRFALQLASCELAIVGAGTSIWECLCLGTPTIALVTADNQEAIARGVPAPRAGRLRL